MYKGVYLTHQTTQREYQMSLFTTKDLTVTSAMIQKCREVSVKEFFIDMNSGKGITSAPTLDKAIEFAKAYQKLLG